MNIIQDVVRMLRQHGKDVIAHEIETLQEDYNLAKAELDKHRKRVAELTSECIEVEEDCSKSYQEINRLKDELKLYRWIPVSEGPPKEYKAYKKYDIVVEWDAPAELRFTTEQDYWHIDGWEHWGRGNTKVIYYRPIILPEQALKENS